MSRHWIGTMGMGAVLVSGITMMSVAQAETPAQALAMLEGRWAGEGWIIQRGGHREEFDVFEDVRIAAGGHAVTLYGEGFAPRGSGRDGRRVHDAVGLVTRDGENFEMRSVTWQGYQQDVPMTMTEDGFAWTLDLGPNGRMEYRATLTPDSWIENGEFCDAQGQCYPTLHMELHRVTE